MSEPMDLIYKDPKYPSSKVVNGLSMAGPRAHLRGMGLVNEELAKPFIGVINTYNEMHPGHIHHIFKITSIQRGTINIHTGA